MSGHPENDDDFPWSLDILYDRSAAEAERDR